MSALAGIENRRIATNKVRKKCLQGEPSVTDGETIGAFQWPVVRHSSDREFRCAPDYDQSPSSCLQRPYCGLKMNNGEMPTGDVVMLTNTN